MSWLIVAVLTLVDWYAPTRLADRPRGRHIAVALAALALSVLADLLIAIAVVLHLPHGSLIPAGLLGLACCVVLADALWYGFHRLAHGALLWPIHRWHHAPEVMNVWVYYLGHPLFQAAAAGVRYAPLWLLGASTAQLAGVAAVQFVWSALAHTNIWIHLGAFEGHLLGPASHAWHHARGSHVNYGIVFGLWDRLGGTLRTPSTNPGQRRLLRYGLRDAGPAAWELTKQLAFPFGLGGAGGDGKRSASGARRRQAPPA